MKLTGKEPDPENNNEDVWAYSDETEDLRLSRVSPLLPDNT